MAMASQTYSRISTMMAASAPVKRIDRKSTRLNSSHSQISYAVFCLKKKKTDDDQSVRRHARSWPRAGCDFHLTHSAPRLPAHGDGAPNGYCSAVTLQDDVVSRREYT